MITHTFKKSLLFPTALACSLVLSFKVHATIVEFQTSLGPIQVNLFDQTTPKTVANFLTYLDEGHYTNTVIHRAYPGFIVQGGGYEFSGEWPLVFRDATRTVVNEPVYSNVKGTIAMARLSGQPDSASAQWFFNLEDNSTNLDRTDSGFTVFGQVIGDGMAIIEEIAQLKLCNEDNELAAGILDGTPVVVGENQQCADLAVPGIENFVVVEQITIIDSSEVTESNLTPLLTKYPDSDGDGVKDIDDAFPSDPTKWAAESPESSSSGGSLAWFSLVMLTFASIRKRFIKS